MAHIMEMLAHLIKETEALPNRIPAPSSSSSATPAVATVYTASYGSSAPVTAAPEHVSTDVTWDPDCPPGHTPYSWYGEGSEFSDPIPFSPSVQQTPAVAPVQKPVTEAKKAPVKAPVQEKKEKKKQQKKEKKKKNKKQPQATNDDQPVFSRLDIRVGKILTAKKHPDADSLYVEQIDVGEDEPREVVSGLVKYIPLDKFIGSPVFVIVNLKPAAMRGIKSYGMVLAVKNDDKVELLLPPKGSVVGERLDLQDSSILDFAPDKQVNSKKKNSAWAKCVDKLRTNSDGVGCFDGIPFVTSAGLCKPTSKMVDAVIS